MTDLGTEQKRKNIRLAMLFGLFAVIIFFTSFPFWKGLFKAVGNQAL